MIYEIIEEGFQLKRKYRFKETSGRKTAPFSLKNNKNTHNNWSKVQFARPLYHRTIVHLFTFSKQYAELGVAFLLSFQ